MTSTSASYRWMYSRFCSRLSSMNTSSTIRRAPTMAKRSDWLKTGSRPFLRRFKASAETPTTSRSPRAAARSMTRRWPTWKTSNVPKVITVRGMGAIVASDRSWARIVSDDHGYRGPDHDDHRRPRRRRAPSAGAAAHAHAGGVAVALRRRGLPGDARAGRVLGVRQRWGRGLDGRRDRGLVRGHRALPAPSGPAGAAHRADPAAQG